MSEEISTLLTEGSGQERVLQFTQFNGGAERGICLQLTQGFGGMGNQFGGLVDEPGFIQLTVEEAILTARQLQKWALEEQEGIPTARRLKE